MDAVCEVRIPEGLRKVFYVLYSAVMRPIPDTDEKAHERISLIKNDYRIRKARPYRERS